MHTLLPGRACAAADKGTNWPYRTFYEKGSLTNKGCTGWSTTVSICLSGTLIKLALSRMVTVHRTDVTAWPPCMTLVASPTRRCWLL